MNTAILFIFFTIISSQEGNLSVDRITLPVEEVYANVLLKDYIIYLEYLSKVYFDSGWGDFNALNMTPLEQNLINSNSTTREVFLANEGNRLRDKIKEYFKFLFNLEKSDHLVNVGMYDQINVDDDTMTSFKIYLLNFQKNSKINVKLHMKQESNVILFEDQLIKGDLICEDAQCVLYFSLESRIDSQIKQFQITQDKNNLIKLENVFIHNETVYPTMSKLPYFRNIGDFIVTSKEFKGETVHCYILTTNKTKLEINKFSDSDYIEISANLNTDDRFKDESYILTFENTIPLEASEDFTYKKNITSTKSIDLSSFDHRVDYSIYSEIPLNSRIELRTNANTIFISLEYDIHVNRRTHLKFWIVLNKNKNTFTRFTLTRSIFYFTSNSTSLLDELISAGPINNKEIVYDTECIQLRHQVISQKEYILHFGLIDNEMSLKEETFLQKNFFISNCFILFNKCYDVQYTFHEYPDKDTFTPLLEYHFLDKVIKSSVSIERKYRLSPILPMKIFYVKYLK